MKGKMTISRFKANTVDQRDRLQDQDSETIIRWLSDLNFWAKQDDSFQRHQEGTGEWFLNDPAFQNWVTSSENTVLWCPGDRKPAFFLVTDLMIAGVGKTIIAYSKNLRFC